MVDSTNISALREKARSLRVEADSIDALLAALDEAVERLGIGDRVSAEVRRPSRATRAATNPTGRKGGKPAGTLSMRWRDNFANLFLIEGAEFDIMAVVRLVDVAEKRIMRPSEVRRLFQNYVDHGYLEVIDQNNYRMLPKLQEIVEIRQKHEGPPAVTEGPSVGDVAERSIASDSKSDGVTSEPSPVGSNPTISAPNPVDIFADLDRIPPKSTTPDW